MKPKEIAQALVFMGIVLTVAIAVCELYDKINQIMKRTPKQRIRTVLNFYHSRGQNREFVNKVYHKIWMPEKIIQK